jgi:hypothetical protein
MFTQYMHHCSSHSNTNNTHALDVLQHIQDKKNCRKLKRYKDKISLTTQEKECTGIGKNKRKNEDNSAGDTTYENEITDLFPDIGFGDSGDAFHRMSNSDPRNTAIIRSRAHIYDHCLVDPPTLGEPSFLVTDCRTNQLPSDSDAGGTETETTNTNTDANTPGADSVTARPTDFFALIQFIRGAVLLHISDNEDSGVSKGTTQQL